MAWSRRSELRSVIPTLVLGAVIGFALFAAISTAATHAATPNLDRFDVDTFPAIGLR
jgi:hypothetical protein